MAGSSDEIIVVSEQGKTSDRAIIMQPDSEDSDSDAELTASSDDEQAQVPTTPSKKRKIRSPDDDHVGPIIVQAAFDAYFTHAAARPQTSTSVFSAFIPPLSSQEAMKFDERWEFFPTRSERRGPLTLH
ncbi:hypothetical protein BDZ89DRAFT_1141071 [Hymenopellis radicata]|nr:hypothetical protein BDZ89DRAFT_1141071 [Hymenopellis radicata]